MIEFKRPGRDTYTHAENPVQQIINITTKIRAGGLEGGKVKYIPCRSIYSSSATLFAMWPKPATVDILFSDLDMKTTPDGLGYYRYHDGLNLLIEVIPYQKLIRDKRNGEMTPSARSWACRGLGWPVRGQRTGNLDMGLLEVIAARRKLLNKGS